MPPRTRRLKVESVNSVAQATGASPSQRTPPKASSASPVKVPPKNNSPTKKAKTIVKQALLNPPPAPERWREVYDLIKQQRRTFVAPVDRMGCDQAGVMYFENYHQANDDHRDGQQEIDEHLETNEQLARDRRLACLVSLMLSSQTKDEITSEATRNLKENLKNSLTVESLRSSSLEEIERCINKVGFWKKKAQFIKLMAHDLYVKHNSDVPKTLDELVALKGVGPKMAFLALSSAWKINLGIGVDTHVHRISNRLGWFQTSDPEATRVHLESWLPKELFQEINHLMVGFGQVICLPVGPRCDECSVGRVPGLCPSFKVATKANNSIKKRVKEAKPSQAAPKLAVRKSRKLNDIDVIPSEDPRVTSTEGESLRSSRYFRTRGKIKREVEEVLIKRESHSTNNLQDGLVGGESKIKVELEEYDDSKCKNYGNSDTAKVETPPSRRHDSLTFSSPLTELEDDDQSPSNFCSNQLLSW